MGLTLLPHQKELIESIHKTTVITGGYGCGKTFALAYGICEAILKEPDKSYAIFSRETCWLIDNLLKMAKWRGLKAKKSSDHMVKIGNGCVEVYSQGDLTTSNDLHKCNHWKIWFDIACTGRYEHALRQVDDTRDHRWQAFGAVEGCDEELDQKFERIKFITPKPMNLWSMKNE